MSDLTNNEHRIGKDVIESLTTGMYEDCRFVYREYIQNAADAIDKAVAAALIKKEEARIHINIEKERKYIEVYDNATGIESSKVMNILGDIANSTKTRGEDKGFRGIGRLGGLAYCSNLIFETSYYGEDTKTIMIWDAKKLRNIINDRTKHQDATDVLAEVVSKKNEPESNDKHYFTVKMEEVSSEDLMDLKKIKEYLEMVAPIDIPSKFLYRNDIEAFMKKENFKVDTYNIYINDEQIFKPYTNYIYEKSNSGKKQVDEISGVDFLIGKDKNGETMYWGWYTYSNFLGQMNQLNTARGIRLRKENIQIGGEDVCRRFFDKTDKQRFSYYFFGEIHALCKELIPNSRRDYFNENDARIEFEKILGGDFKKLEKLCYCASLNNTYKKTNKKISEKTNQLNNGTFNSKNEKEKLSQEIDKLKKEASIQQKKLQNIEPGSIEEKYIEHCNSSANNYNQEAEEYENPVSPTGSRVNYRTDDPKYSKYKKQEKKLISRIFELIGDVISDERQRNELICYIEEGLTK